MTVNKASDATERINRAKLVANTGKRTANVRDLVGNGSRIIKLFEDPKDRARPYYAANPTDGAIDILRYGSWCSNPPEARGDIVPMTITEYQPEYGKPVNSLARLISTTRDILNSKNLINSGGITNNPIKNTILANKTNFSYIFPYLALGSQTFSTQFGEDDSDIITKGVKSLVGDFRSARVGRAGYKGGRIQSGISSVMGNGLSIMGDVGSLIFPAINPVKTEPFYNGSSPMKTTLTIELSNTLSYEQSRFNKEFVELITHNAGQANLRNFVVGDSPCVYSIEIKGIRWIPLCHINISYEGVGNITNIGDMTIPEAYIITLDIVEVFPPLRFISDAYLKHGDKIPAINSSQTSICDLITGKESGDPLGGLGSG